MNPTYKLPFYGVSKSTYFEYTFVEILFKEIPTEKQKEQIEKNIPFLMNEFSWERSFMTAGSG